MPEYREGAMAGKTVGNFADSEPESNRLLEDIQADATAKEQVTHPPGSLASQGHVYSLPASTTIKRGQCGAQTIVYPLKYANKEDTHILSFGLVLTGAWPSPRNVIMKFVDALNEEYWLQVCLYVYTIQFISSDASECVLLQIQLLKHTVPQVYSKAEWSDAICVVDKSVRNFVLSS